MKVLLICDTAIRVREEKEMDFEHYTFEIAALVCDDCISFDATLKAGVSEALLRPPFVLIVPLIETRYFLLPDDRAIRTILLRKLMLRMRVKIPPSRRALEAYWFFEFPPCSLA